MYPASAEKGGVQHCNNVLLLNAKEGAALVFDPKMSFSRPRDWSILFSAAACLFFDL